MKPWGSDAEAVARHGWSPLPVIAGKKRPRFEKWEVACAGRSNLGFIRRHAARNPTDSVGIACGVLRDRAGESIGRLFVIDIDADSWAEADAFEDLAFHHFGKTPFVRSRPNSPRRALLYRLNGRVKSEKLTGAEILGADHQFVAFGLHPSGTAYAWRGAAPADTPATAVPLVTRDALEAFRTAAGAKMTEPRPFPRAGSRKACSVTAGFLETIAAGGVGRLSWTIFDGLVVDGRESFLTLCVGKAGGNAARAWRMFSAHAALGRAKGSDCSRWWGVEDAEAKAKAWQRNAERRRDGVRSTGRPRAPHRETLTLEQRQAHAAATERAHREGRIGVTAVRLSAAMLDLAAGHLGACTAALATLCSAIGRGRTAVTDARAELHKAGLWEHRRSGVYSPVLAGEVSETQHPEFSAKTTPSVRTTTGPKVSGGGTPTRPAVREHGRADGQKAGVPEWGKRIEGLRLWREGIAPALAAVRVQSVGPPPFSLRAPNPFPARDLASSFSRLSPCRP